MPFDYYNRLSQRDKAIYRKSDQIAKVPLPDPGQLALGLPRLEQALEDESRSAVQQGCHQMVSAINSQLKVPSVALRVLAARPSKTWGELYGLYELAEEDEAARITVWMRTAQRRQVVAFRTFLRTVLHELCHHLDYEYFDLADSFHTEGFFKRESSLFHQLNGSAPAGST